MLRLFLPSSQIFRYQASNMVSHFECDHMLGTDGLIRLGKYRMRSGTWDLYESSDLIGTAKGSSFITPLLPVDFHRHSIGGIDLSNLDHLNFDAINRVLSEERVAGVLTFFLVRSDLLRFYEIANTFSEAKRRQQYPYIYGLALEGPLLSSPGGTPSPCVWTLTKREWDILGHCGELGLKYLVLSPDADLQLTPGIERAGPSIDWIIQHLFEAGISPALGHFQKRNPEASAQTIQNVFDIAAKRGTGVVYPPVLSDHLFNDMPLKIRHAWRTADQKSRRAVELEAMHTSNWNLENIREQLGPVPAALIRGAHDGLMTLCINFDGEHVDLAIAQQVVRIVGADHIIALTDRVDGSMLARQQLFPSRENRLLHRQDGIVVASSIALDEQMDNMRQIGMSQEEIWKIVSINPCRVLGIKAETDRNGRPLLGSFIASRHVRDIFDIRGRTQSMSIGKAVD